MYKIEEVSIEGFWMSHHAECKFKNDVNVIIGRNGTGKTTFMNVLHAVLSLDIEELADSEFKEVTIKLSKKDSKKTIKVTKQGSESNPYQRVTYQISKKEYNLRVSKDDRLYRPMSRRIMEEASELKLELSGLVSLSSLSVYRMRNFDEYEIRDKKGQRIIAPVDYKLAQLMGELTRFQLELSKQAHDIAVKLQKDVLASILYEPKNEKARTISIPSKGGFSSEKELSKLQTAYTQLQVIDDTIMKRITTHIEAIDTAVKNYSRSREGDLKTLDADFSVDFAAFEAFSRTKEIVDMSLDSEKKSKEVSHQLNLFLSILGKFIPEKEFSLGSEGLEVLGSNNKPVGYEKLSSGEKQLLILLVEALLQKEKPFVYLADEPELSLHIDWQKKVIPSIIELNPNAQIIVATHSPEIAGSHRDAIVDMSEIVNV